MFKADDMYVSSYIYYVYFQVTDISIILNWFFFTILMTRKHNMMTTEMNLILFHGIEIDFDNFSYAFSTMVLKFCNLRFSHAISKHFKGNLQVTIYNPYLVSFFPCEYTWRKTCSIFVILIQDVNPVAMT